MKKLWRLILASLIICWSSAALASEYDFAIPEAESTPYELGGKLEMRYSQQHLNPESARYRLNHFRADPGSYTDQLTLQAELKGSYKLGIAQLHLLTHHEYLVSSAEDDWFNRVYQAYVSLKPSANLTIEAGKKSYLWGKGYAWNPAAFINRSKDPDDPELNLEGYTVLGLDYIKSFTDSPLNNLGVTLLALPVMDDWENSSLGDDGDVNLAAKLYLLWHDTDLDFIYFGGPNQPDSFGFDFAKNLADNFEVHGEIGLKLDVDRKTLDADGSSSLSTEDQLSYLLGVRYLNSHDTTFVLEYYHNGAGYDGDELDDFFAYQFRAYEQWLESGDNRLMNRADQATRPYYRQRNYGQDYLYLKISQKEPFDILYFNPWVAMILNLEDMSFNLQPGMTYTPVTNLQITFRVAVPIGPPGTEFGEKQASARPELWIRYYF
jgi:hypothetical protein